MDKYIRTGACFFAAMVPGLASLHLEGFLGASLIVPFLIIACAILEETFEKPTVGNCILCAMILATATTVYTEATLIFVVLIAIIFIWSICIGKIKIKKIYIPVAIFAGMLIINIQFLKPIYNNILKYISPSHSLDFIYQFGLSGQGFAYTYFGITGNQGLRLLAVLIALAGFCGLVIKFIENKNPMILSFLALVLSPIVFFSMDQIYLYNYFRLILLASPIIVLGLWLFFEKIYNTLKESNLIVKIIGIPIKRISLILLVLCISFVSIISIFGTSQKIYHTIDQIDSRVQYSPSQDMILLRQKLNSMEGNNIFLVTQLNLESSWLTYYARRNNVWLCHESVDNYYIITGTKEDYSYLDYSKMPDPDNVVIVHDPTYYNAVYPEVIRSRVDSFMISNTHRQVIGPSNETSDHTFKLVVYSKETVEGSFNVTIGFDGPSNISINMMIGGKAYNGVKNDDNLVVPLSINKGFTELDINTISSAQSENVPEIKLTQWILRIDE